MTNKIPISPGEPAPDFSLPAHDERQIRLSDFQGQRHVILAFYPFDFSPVCSLQLPGLQERLSQIRELDGEILGISVDSTWAHRAFAERLGLQFPLLSDYTREVSRSYGVLREEGFADRALFIVDKQGIIRYAHLGELGSVPDPEPVVQALQALKASGG